jgi:aminopeptidase N
MWFYGMVGNSQFRDPWLDEAFATYAETVLDPPSIDLDEVLALDGDVGDSMADFAGAGDETYFGVVYGKGGAALIAARQQAGPGPFEAALRCYVDASAWSIATPDDVAAAMAELPAALDVLTQVGALDEADLPD